MRPATELLISGRYADYLHNTLNEVLHGFGVDIEQQFHVSYDILYALMRELDAADSSYQLSPESAALLLRASELCNAEFEDSEFQTRLGYYRADAHAVMDKLKELARDAQPLSSHTALSAPINLPPETSDGRLYIRNLR